MKGDFTMYKLDLPKSIDIAGRKFKIIRSKQTRGAEFHVQERFIKLGEGRNKDEEFTWLFHEIAEVIYCIHCKRFPSEYTRDDYMFVVDHMDFEFVMEDLANVVKSIKKYIPN